MTTKQFDVQLYPEEREARAWVNGCVITMRPAEDGSFDRHWVAGTFSVMGFNIQKDWQETDWGWMATFVGP